MGVVERTLQYLRKRRENVISGNVNCIPSPFKSFRNDFVGTEQETYYLVSGVQKSAKSKFTSFIFLYNNILYAYKNPKKVRIRIFYIPLEETKEKITMRFMVYILFVMSNHRIRISQKQLESTLEDAPVDEEILKIFEENEEYKKILAFFEDRVTFIEQRNPTGIWKEIVDYADTHGKRHMIKVPMKNQQTGEIEMVDKFDTYTADDENEYVEIIIDHISLINTENGMDLRESIKKMSKYLMELRNNYRYIPVVVQQQGSEVQSLDAFKNMKIRPTPAGLQDCKDTAKDCNVMLGLTNPYAFELKEYLKYDITKLKDSQRFLEVVLSRDGEGNGVKALYFDGATSFFQELPAPTSPDYEDFMPRVYRLIANLKQRVVQAVTMLLWKKPTKTE